MQARIFDSSLEEITREGKGGEQEEAHLSRISIDKYVNDFGKVEGSREAFKI